MCDYRQLSKQRCGEIRAQQECCGRVLVLWSSAGAVVGASAVVRCWCCYGDCAGVLL